MQRTTRVTYRQNPGFLQRLGQSCSGVIIGLCLFIFSFIILYFNEGNSVATTLMLDEGLRQVVSLDESTNLNMNGKLVHYTGVLKADKEVFDPIYGLHLPCVRLHRKVEIYQWVEYSSTKEVNEGDRTREERTYTYSTEWKSNLQLSRDFAEEVGHRNPTEMRFKDEIFEARSISVGRVRLSSGLIHKINWFKPVHRLVEPKTGLDAFIDLHYYYHGKDPSMPLVGDMRVSYECAGITETGEIGMVDAVSVVAKLIGDTFGPFEMKKGKQLELLYRGVKSAEEMFHSEQTLNNTTTWFLRLFGSVLMFVGLSIMSRVVVTLVDWIPVVREIVAMSVTMFNLTLAAFLSLCVIAFSWLWFRPVVAASLFAVSLLPWYVSRHRAQSYYSR